MESVPPGRSYESQVFEIIRPSLVRVHAAVPSLEDEPRSTMGIGFVMDDRGIILTSLHIVRDALQVSVIFADGFESEAEVIGSVPEHELVVLRALIVRTISSRQL